MVKAVWNNQIVAESDHCEVVEGNYYFPPESIKREYFIESSHRSTCPWKGLAYYFDLKVDGQVNENAAWYYPQPNPAAQQIKDHVAFWKGVIVS
jgi:uncharacterized protein (DUF427 family)